MLCFNYILINSTHSCILHHIGIKSNIKNEDPHVVPDVNDFLSSDEHKHMFSRIMQSTEPPQNTHKVNSTVHFNMLVFVIFVSLKKTPHELHSLCVVFEVSCLDVPYT